MINNYLASFITASPLLMGLLCLLLLGISLLFTAQFFSRNAEES